MSEPIFTQTVTDLKFDPAMVPPSSTRAERLQAHDIWWQKTLAKKPAPLKLVRARKAASK